MKATGKVAHGGGRKMEPDSDEYKIVRRWIAAGMPWGKKTIPSSRGSASIPIIA